MSKELEKLRAKARQEANQSQVQVELKELPFMSIEMLRKTDRLYDGKLLSPRTKGGRAYFSVTIPGKGEHGITTFPNSVPKGMVKDQICILHLGLSKPKRGYDNPLVVIERITISDSTPEVEELPF